MLGIRDQALELGLQLQISGLYENALLGGYGGTGIHIRDNLRTGHHSLLSRLHYSRYLFGSV